MGRSESLTGTSPVSVFVEFLTVRIWFGTVWPQWRRARRTHPDAPCWFVDATPAARWIAQRMARMTGGSIEPLSFRLVDVRDERGQLIRLRVAYVDIDEAQQHAAQSPVFQAFLRAGALDATEAEYLAKCVGAISLTDRTTMWRALLLVQIAAWRMRETGGGRAILCLERRPWEAVLDAYARQNGVDPVVSRRVFRWSEVLRDALGPFGLAAVRKWRDRIAHLVSLWRRGGARGARPTANTLSSDPVAPGARVAVEYLGQFNLDAPAYYSDLFFWQQSALPGTDVVLLFPAPQDPVDETKMAVLRRHGISAVALYPGASTTPDAPLFSHAPARRTRPAVTHADWQHLPEWRWLSQRLETYDVAREYWEALFKATQSRLYVTWYRVDERIYPIAQAMRRLGGATAIYQRSFQIDPNPEMSVDVELMFGFSMVDAEVERRSGSKIDNHVAVGYTADHRIALCRPAAQQIRERLLATGATRVIAYFDENSADDSRWHTGHEFMRDNYVFVLQRLLADPQLGLVLKPKRPSSLRRRLGPVAPLLEEALATGRCHLCESGPMHGSDPPVVAALAVDLVVHGHLCGSTAGLEAALAGVPTLLLDREGWPASPMFGLGTGTVVFTNWPDLWSALEEHWRRPGGIEGFGRWTPMIETLDPFRDGRAAERMGTYLDWVIKGFQAGQSRDEALAQAADRYAAQWGHDKITRVDGRHVAPTLSTGRDLRHV